MKISTSLVDFSTELAEKPNIYELLFLVAIYSLENDNKNFSEIRRRSQHQTFFQIGTHFDVRSKTVKALTFPKDFFTIFVHVSILCLRSQESSQEQGISLLKQQLFQSFTYLYNKESKKHLPRIHVPVKLADGKILMKREKDSSYLIYNIVSLSKTAGKLESLFWKK